MRATIVYEGKKLSGGQEKKETTRLGEVKKEQTLLTLSIGDDRRLLPRAAIPHLLPLHHLRRLVLLPPAPTTTSLSFFALRRRRHRRHLCRQTPPRSGSRRRRRWVGGWATDSVLFLKKKKKKELEIEICEMTLLTPALAGNRRF